MRRLSHSPGRSWKRITPLEAATLSTVAALLVFQLFVPPIVGMADNGDFAKVAARLCMEPPSPVRESDQRFWHFSITQYEVMPQHCLAWWQWSSMSLFAWTAKQLHDVVGSESYFDIRALGAVCGAVWLACVWGMLVLLRGAPTIVKAGAALATVVICSDVLYVAYFHSFYGDCAALIFVFVTCLFAWRAASSGAAVWILGFGLSGVLLVWAKGPHVLIAPWLIVFALFWWWQQRSPAWLATSALIVAASAASLLAVPQDYASGTTFNVIFARLLPMSREPARVLAAFELPPEAAAFSGEYVYTATNPYKDPAWRARYAGSLTPRRLGLFYLRNPGMTFRNLWRDLRASATMRQFVYYRHRGRQQPDEPARPILRWSDLRSALLRAAPWHLPLFYAAMVGAAVVTLVRGSTTRHRIWATLCLALAGAGITEFVITSLFDSLETERHLFVFHVLTDALVVHAVIAAACVVHGRRKSGRLVADL